MRVLRKKMHLDALATCVLRTGCKKDSSYLFFECSFTWKIWAGPVSQCDGKMSHQLRLSGSLMEMVLPTGHWSMEGY